MNRLNREQFWDAVAPIGYFEGNALVDIEKKFTLALLPACKYVGVMEKDEGWWYYETPKGWEIV